MNIVAVLKRAPEVYKAITAFLVSLTALEGTVAAVAVSTHAAPVGWVQGLVAAGAALTGFTTWWVTNEKVVEEVLDEVADIFGDKPAAPAAQTVAPGPVVVTSAITAVAIDDVQRAIQQYHTKHPEA